MKYAAFSLALLATSTAQGSPKRMAAPTLAQRIAVQEVASLLEGTMESTAQALAKRSEFIPVRLTQCRVRVEGGPSHSSSGNVFLYTEQAVTWSLKAPYRQRFTRLAPVAVDGWQVTSTVYRPAAPAALIGMCDKPEAERVVAFDAMGKRECAVFLKKYGQIYAGLTPGQGCESEYNGAVRVTSKATLTPEGMDSWDQGWAADGTQAWGAETGPYQFRRVDPTKVDADVDQLTWRLSGHFDNSEQVKADASFSPIDYVLCPVNVTDSPWSKGTRTTLGRQRIQLPGGREILRARVHVISSVAGEMTKMDFYDFAENASTSYTCAEPFADRKIAYSDLVNMNCPMDFAWNDQERAYVGRTREGGCPSAYRGSKTLNIKGVLRREQLDIWEQWFDENGTQVAGSKVGPYMYKLTENQ